MICASTNYVLSIGSAEKQCLQAGRVCHVVVIPQSRMATATSRPPARDIRDTVNPSSGFGQSAMLTSYRVWVSHQMVMVMVMNDLLPPPFVQCQSALAFWKTAISKFDHENPWSRSCVWSKSRSRLTFKIQRSRLWSRSNPLFTFEALEFNRYVCF